jgi:hypothetical protein
MKRTMLIITGIIVLVALLAGAAFVGGQLLNGQGLPVQASSGGLKITTGQGGKPGQTFQLDIQPAKELPQTPADAKGLFDHRKDNSIFVGTGQVRMTAQKDPSGNVTTSATHDGPTVEVVVTSQTVVYRDVTLKQFNGQPPSGKIQQVVEPGSLDEIGQDSTITVWGKKTSDRFIADVLVYSPPAILRK